MNIGSFLQDEYGHRVRIATHPEFRELVQDEIGLEFFSTGGVPSELMAFIMVKNPGLIPKLSTIREAEIQRRRSSMAVRFEGFWRAVIGTTDDERDTGNLKMMGAKAPFVADAIIANPPSIMAHVHSAEKLGIPLHMVFTFPCSPTQQFPHPVANIKPQRSPEIDIAGVVSFLDAGEPTMIVPFFGDQPFWGAMNMTVELFAEGIKQCLTEEAQANVQKIADSISSEGDGAENAVKSFHRSLPLAGRSNLRCSILEDRLAVWQLRNSSSRLSTLAAELLHEKGTVEWSDLKLTTNGTTLTGRENRSLVLFVR
ncbi:hypothetical protein LTR08_000752 [Meristemomyces frigidus]|nr:hypothetical protein LTR08_000752 [Meristemomyces frigidus]